MAEKTKVSQETIKEIQNLGMKGALAKWNKGGNSQEFDEAIRRYYGKGKREGASSGGTAAESGPAPQMTRDLGEATKNAAASATKGTQSNLAPESAKAAAERKLAASRNMVETARAAKNAQTSGAPSPGRKVSEMSLEERVASGRRALDAKPGLHKGRSLVGNPLHGIVHGIGNVAKWGTEQRRSGAEAQKRREAARNAPSGRKSELTEKQQAALRRLK